MGKQSKQKTRKRLFIQFVEYMVSGGAWFWVGYGAFAVLDKVFSVPFWPTKISSYVIGASVNFLLQRFWVFHTKKQSGKELGTAAKRYYSLMGINFLLDQGIVGGLREFGVSPYIGQFISSGFFTVWNWLWYSLWVFKKQAAAPRKQHSPVLHRHKKVRIVRKKEQK
jgi:putative flippase GtrA